MTNARILALNKEPLTEELGKLVIQAQNKALANKEFFDIGISGGSLAPTLAASLVGNKEAQWSKWRVWLVDERIVPLDHPDSNWAGFVENVLSKLPGDNLPQGFPLNEELLKGDYEKVSSAEFAADYQKRLEERLGPKPALDIALLGMGPDGHTCSLFPGKEMLKEEKLYISSLDDSPKPPPRRISFTKPALALADQIVFFAAGAAKKDAIHGIFKDEDESYPTKQVIDVAKHQVVFLTDPAALGE